MSAKYSGKYHDKTGWDRLEHQLNWLVPAEKKKWVWRSMGQKAIALNRARIRAQKNLDGSMFDPRSDGSNAKMMRKILKGDPFRSGGKSQTRVTLTDYGVVIKHPWEKAVEHHFGATRTQRAYTHEELLQKQSELKEYNRSYEHGARVGQSPEFGSDAGRKYGTTNQQETPCTKEQARILKRDVGFKKLTLDGGRTHVAATIKNLQDNFSMATAGYIIRKHRIRQGKHPKSHWTINLPSRHILGLSETDERILMNHMSALIAKYSYFKFTMQPGEYQSWAADFMETNMANAA